MAELQLQPQWQCYGFLSERDEGRESLLEAFQWHEAAQKKTLRSVSVLYYLALGAMITSLDCFKRWDVRRNLQTLSKDCGFRRGTLAPLQREFCETQAVYHQPLVPVVGLLWRRPALPSWVLFVDEALWWEGWGQGTVTHDLRQYWGQDELHVYGEWRWWWPVKILLTYSTVQVIFLLFINVWQLKRKMLRL